MNVDTLRKIIIKILNGINDYEKLRKIYTVVKYL